MSEQLVAGAVEQARLRTAIRDLPEPERKRLAQAVLDELAEEHELPEEVNEQLFDGMLGALLAGKRSEREILGRGERISAKRLVRAQQTSEQSPVQARRDQGTVPATAVDQAPQELRSELTAALRDGSARS